MIMKGNANIPIMPIQKVEQLHPGAHSPMDSALIVREQEIGGQLALIGIGGSKMHKGGQGQPIVVPPVQPGAVNANEISNIYSKLTSLSALAKSQAAYDGGQKGGLYRNKQNKRKKRNKSHKRNKSIKRRNRRKTRKI
jgi:hypothetical protein